MISTLLMVALVAGNGCPPIAPPINPRFNTRAAVGCVCDDSGVCQCTEAECGCADCPRTATTAKPANRLITKRVFAGYTYMRQCGPNGCRMVRVPMYHSVQVEE